MQLSYLEVYNDRIFDLLAPHTGRTPERPSLNIRESVKGGLLVEGLTSQVVASAGEILSEIAHGDTRRVVAPMKMNQRSSRGHALCSVCIHEMTTLASEQLGEMQHIPHA